MRFVGYVRVSFVGSRGGESFRSPDDQAAAIRAWAAGRGHTVEILAPELDESGGRADRPILLEAIAGIESGRWDGLIAYDLSRIMRDTRHLLDLVDRVTSAGGELATCEGDIDWLTSTGRMFGTFKAAIDEQMRRAHSERFRKLNRASAERGVWKFRQVPFGYRLAGKRPCGLVPSTDAAKVRRAFKQRISGASVTAVAKGMGMTPGGARAILRNRVYLGEIRVGENVNREAHKPIIDPDTFDAVQAMQSFRPPRSKTAPTLLAGLVRCQPCGHIMRGGVGGKGHRTYSCHVNHSDGPCQAAAAITQTKLDDYVGDVARAEIERWQVVAGSATDQTAHLREELARAKSELAAYLEATEAAGVGVDHFASGAKSRREAVDAAQAELDGAARLAPVIAGLDTGIWDLLTVPEQNRLLRGLLDAVVVAPVGRGKNIPVADRVRIFAAGTLGDLNYRGGGIARPIEALPFPHTDDERLIGVLGGKDRL